MKIYTKTGDKGETSLWGGSRVSKTSLRVETYGEVDELASLLGVIIAHKPIPPLTRHLQKVQSELLAIASDLATPYTSKPVKVIRLSESAVARLESEIDKYSEDLPVLTNFILPSGSMIGSYFHYARSVCRRVERRAVGLSEIEEINQNCILYLNRLSDWLFTIARWQNIQEQVIETVWNINSVDKENLKNNNDTKSSEKNKSVQNSDGEKASDTGLQTAEPVKEI